MTKIKQDFTMWSGDHKDLTYTTTDGDSASVDLTGASVYWCLAPDAESGSLVRLTTDSGSGITLSGCTFTVSLSPAHTSGLAGTYYYEAQVRDSETNIGTVAVGNIKINYDVAG